jgi:hypothetical protein
MNVEVLGALLTLSVDKTHGTQGLDKSVKNALRFNNLSNDPCASA